MNDYSIITSQIVGDVDETLERVRRAIASDERYVGHIVDESAQPAVLLVIVKG